jgi:hypothetical protein
MATVQSVVCDECGRKKGDVNHWFVYPYSDDPETDGLGFVIFRSDAVEMAAKQGVNLAQEARKDYCSQQCVTTIFQRWLDTGSVDKPQVIHPPDQFLEVEQSQLVVDEEVQQ